MAESKSFFEQHHFLLRRLHSLTGIVPIGVFLIAHLTTNSSLAWGKFASRGEADSYSVLGGGAHYFQEEVHWINTSVPHLFLIEVTLWVSIGFHSLLGVYYATSGKQNLQRYAYQDNWRYSLQRWSGYIGILFILYHIATLRWGWSFLVPGGTEWSHHFSASTLAAALKGSYEGITAMGIAVSALYFAGITMLVYHFANGLWTAAITWGLTISKNAQQRWGYVCAALGVGLMLGAWSALGAAIALDPNEAAEIELELIEADPAQIKALDEKYGEGEWQAKYGPRQGVPAIDDEDVPAVSGEDISDAGGGNPD
ncbi:MAG: hypothetical protein AAGI17_08030 [Planctomycetota bacterium]